MALGFLTDLPSEHIFMTVIQVKVVDHLCGVDEYVCVLLIRQVLDWGTAVWSGESSVRD